MDWLTSSQVWFFHKEVISSFIMAFHLGSVKASYTLLGIDTVNNWLTNDLFVFDKRCLDIKYFLRYLTLLENWGSYVRFGRPLVRWCGNYHWMTWKLCKEYSQTTIGLAYQLGMDLKFGVKLGIGLKLKLFASWITMELSGEERITSDSKFQKLKRKFKSNINMISQFFVLLQQDNIVFCNYRGDIFL